MNIYVGNLAAEVTEDDLREAFAAFGEVASVKVVRDSVTGQSRQFGFVEMASDDEARAAIGDLNGRDIKGNEIQVEPGRAKPANRSFGGGSRPGGRGGPRGGGRPGGRPGGRAGGRPGGGGGRRGGPGGGTRPGY